MTNPLKGEAALVLDDGRRFNLVLDIEGLITAEGVFGQPLERMMIAANMGLVGAHRAMLFGALQRHHRDLTLDDVTQIVMKNRAVVIDMLTKAIEAAFPEPSEEADRGNGKARPAGKSSGSNGAKRASIRNSSGRKPRAASN